METLIRTALDVFLDIETLPTLDAAMIADIGAAIGPPGNYKKPETIAAWEQTEKPAIVAQQVARTALDGTYGRICCIGVAFGDGPAQSWIGDERDVLAGFFSTIRVMEGENRYGSEITWIGHNVRHFDLRFVWQRAVIHQLKLPRSIRMAISSRPWSDGVVDTMTLWNPERDRRVSLQDLCRALGIDCPKSDMTGKDVAGAWEAGQFDRIEAYCRGDVEATRACYRRMMFAETTA